MMTIMKRPIQTSEKDVLKRTLVKRIKRSPLDAITYIDLKKKNPNMIMLYAVLEKYYPRKMNFHTPFLKGRISLITIIGVIQSCITSSEGHEKDIPQNP